MSFAVLVAFRYDEENSIYYKKCKNFDELVKSLRKAVEKGSDFVSIRFPSNRRARKELEKEEDEIAKICELLGEDYTKVAFHFDENGNVSEIIRFKKWLAKEEWSRINEKLKKMGFKWVSNGEKSRWIREGEKPYEQQRRRK